MFPKEVKVIFQIVDFKHNHILAFKFVFETEVAFGYPMIRVRPRSDIQTKNEFPKGWFRDCKLNGSLSKKFFESWKSHETFQNGTIVENEFKIIFPFSSNLKASLLPFSFEFSIKDELNDFIDTFEFAFLFFKTLLFSNYVRRKMKTRINLQVDFENFSRMKEKVLKLKGTFVPPSVFFEKDILFCEDEEMKKKVEEIFKLNYFLKEPDLIFSHFITNFGSSEFWKLKKEISKRSINNNHEDNLLFQVIQTKADSNFVFVSTKWSSEDERRQFANGKDVQDYLIYSTRMKKTLSGVSKKVIIPFYKSNFISIERIQFTQKLELKSEEIIFDYFVTCEWENDFLFALNKKDVYFSKNERTFWNPMKKINANVSFKNVTASKEMVCFQTSQDLVRFILKTKKILSSNVMIQFEGNYKMIRSNEEKIFLLKKDENKKNFTLVFAKNDSKIDDSLNLSGNILDFWILDEKTIAFVENVKKENKLFFFDIEKKEREEKPFIENIKWMKGDFIRLKDGTLLKNFNKIDENVNFFDIIKGELIFAKKDFLSFGNLNISNIKCFSKTRDGIITLVNKDVE